MSSTISKVKLGTSTASTVKFKPQGSTNTVEPKLIVLDNGSKITPIYCKVLSLTNAGSAPIKSISCNRTSSPYAAAATGTVSLGTNFYYNDVVKLTITNYAGYSGVTYKVGGASYTSGSTYTISGNVSITATGSQVQLSAPSLTDATTSTFAITNPNSVKCKYTVYTDSTGSREVIVSGVAIGANSTAQVSSLASGYTYYAYLEDNSGEKYATSDTDSITLSANQLLAPEFTYAGSDFVRIVNNNNQKVSLYGCPYLNSSWSSSYTEMDINIRPGDETDCNLEQLGTGCTYAKLKFVDPAGINDDSSATYVRPTLESSSPVVTATNNTSITVRNDNLFYNRSLTLHWFADGSSTSSTASIADNGGTYTATGLIAGNTYYFWFTDDNDVPTFLQSYDVETATTLASPSLYARTYNTITVLNSNNTTVNLTFNGESYTMTAGERTTISGLSAETGYSAKFTSVSGVNSDQVTLYTCIATPTITANDETSLYITNNGSQAYTYYYKEYSASSYTAGSSIAKNVITTVSSLKNGSRYDFYMNHGSTNYGNSAVATGYTSLSKPAISSIAQTSFTITNNNNVAVTCECNGSSISLAASGSATISDLTPGTLYDVTFASKQSGATTITSNTSATTTKYDFSAITITPNATSTNATTGFSLANPNTVAVTVAYGASGNTVSLAANGGTGSVSSLAWNTTYSFTIQADSTHYAKTQTATTNKRTLSLPSVSAGVSNNKGYFTATNPSANPAVNMYYSTSSGQTTSGTKFATNLAAGSTSSQVSDLAINTKYYIYEEAYDGKQIAVEYQFTTGKGTLAAPTMSNGGVAHQLVITNSNSIAVTYHLATANSTVIDESTISANSSKTITTSTATSSGTKIADCTTYKVYFSATNYNNTSAVSANVLGALVAPSISVTSSTVLAITNSSSNPSVEAYYNTSNTITGATLITSSLAAGGSVNATGLTKNTTYYVFFKASNYVNSSSSAKTNNVFTAPTMSVGAISTAVNTTINITNNGPSAATVKYKKHSDSSWTTFGSVASNASTGTITAAWNTDYDVQLSASGMDTYTASNLGSTALRKLYDPSYTISYADVSVSNTAISPWTSAVAVYAYVIENDDTGTYQEYDIAAGGTHGFSSLKNGTNYTIRFDATGYTSAGVSTHTNLIAPAISNVGTTSFRVTNNNNIAVTCGVNSASYTIASGGYKDITGLSMNTSYTVTFESADAVHSSASQTTAKGTITTPTISAGATSTASTTSISVKNNASYAVTLYYKLSTASSYTSYGSVASGATATISSLTWNSTYNLKLSVTNYNDYTANQATNKRTLSTPSITAYDTTTMTVKNNDSLTVSLTLGGTSKSVASGSTATWTGLTTGAQYTVYASLSGYNNSASASAYTTLIAPTFGNITTTSARIYNSNGVAVNCYINKSLQGSIAAGSYQDVSDLAINTSYSVYYTYSSNTSATSTLTTSKGTFTAPTITLGGVTTSSTTTIAVKNNGPVTAAVYYKKTADSSWTTLSSSLASGSSATISSASWNTSYDIKLTASNYNDYSTSKTTNKQKLVSPTITVVGNTYATVKNNDSRTVTLQIYQGSTLKKSQSTASGGTFAVTGLTTNTAYKAYAYADGYTISDSASFTTLMTMAAPTVYSFATQLRVINPSSNPTVTVSCTDGTVTTTSLAPGYSTYITGLSPAHEYTVTFTNSSYESTSTTQKTTLADLTTTVGPIASTDTTYFTVTNPTNNPTVALYINNTLIDNSFTAGESYTYSGASWDTDYTVEATNSSAYGSFVTTVHTNGRQLVAPVVSVNTGFDDIVFTITNSSSNPDPTTIEISYWDDASGEYINVYSDSMTSGEIRELNEMSPETTYKVAFSADGYAEQSTTVTTSKYKLLSPTIQDYDNNWITIENPNTITVNAYYKSSSESSYTDLGEIYAEGSSYDNTLMVSGLACNTTYYFYFADNSSEKTYANSDVTSQKTALGDISAPYISLGTTSTSSSTSFTLQNSSYNPTVTAYISTNGSSWTSIGTLTSGQTSSSQTASWNTKYYYKLTNSSYNDCTGNFTTNLRTLNAPTVTGASTTSVTVTNNEAVAGTAYLYNSSTGDPASSASISASGSVEFKSLSANTTYYAAVGASGYNISSRASGKTWSNLTAPTVTVAATSTSSSTSFTIKNNAGVSVTVYYKTSSASSYTTYGTLASGDTSSSISAVWNTTYNIKVSASGYGDGTASATTNKRTLATPSASAASSTSITITNNDSASATYYVYLGSATSATTSGSISGSGTATATGLAASNTYKVLIKASGYNDSSYTSVTTLGALSAPTFTAAAATTASTTSFTVKNNSSVAVELYYNTAGTSSSSWTDYGQLAANTTSSSITLASWNTTYYYKLVASGYETKTGTLGTTNKKKLSSPTVSPSTSSATSIVISDTSGVASTYYVYNYSSGSQVATGALSASGSTTVTGLTAQTTYKVKITASNYTDSDYATATTYGTLSAPTFTAGATSTSSTTSFTVKNNSSVAVTLYYGTTSSASTSYGTLNSGATATISSAAWNTTYYYKLTASSYVTKSGTLGTTNKRTLTAPTVSVGATSTAVCTEMTITNPSDNPTVAVYIGSDLITDSLGSGSSISRDTLDWNTTYTVMISCSTQNSNSTSATTVKGTIADPTITVGPASTSTSTYFSVTNNCADSVYVYYMKRSASSYTYYGALSNSDTSSNITADWNNGQTSSMYAVKLTATNYNDYTKTFYCNYRKLYTPTLTASTTTSGAVTVTNPNSVEAYIYYKKSTDSSYSTWGTKVSASGSLTMTGLTVGTTYNMYLMATNYTNSAVANVTPQSVTTLDDPVIYADDDTNLTEYAVNIYNTNSIAVNCEVTSDDGSYYQTGTIMANSYREFAGMTEGTHYQVEFEHNTYSYGDFTTRPLQPSITDDTYTAVVVQNNSAYEGIVYFFNSDTDVAAMVDEQEAADACLWSTEAIVSGDSDTVPSGIFDSDTEYKFVIFAGEASNVRSRVRTFTTSAESTTTS